MIEGGREKPGMCDTSILHHRPSLHQSQPEKSPSSEYVPQKLPDSTGSFAPCRVLFSGYKPHGALINPTVQPSILYSDGKCVLAVRNQKGHWNRIGSLLSVFSSDVFSGETAA